MGSKNPIYIKFIQKNTRKETQREHFLEVLFEKNPIDREEDSFIKIDVDALEVIYNPIAIQYMEQFFDLDVSDETLKELTNEQFEKANASTMETLEQLSESELKQIIEISIKSPLIVLPFT